MTSVAADIPQILGYEQEHIHLDLRFETPEPVRNEMGWASITFNVVVAQTEAASPYLTIIADFSTSDSVHPDDKYALKEWDMMMMNYYSHTSPSKYTVLLTNAYLAISSVPEG